MPLKDYYKLLELPPNATQADIKKSYRRLAFKYHPDKNPDNAFADAHFKELQEAYATLSHPARRSAYNQERWLSGMGMHVHKQQAITPEWILEEAIRLSKHMQVIDTYRMNHTALCDYVFLLLSDANIAILKNAAHSDTNNKIIHHILVATTKLQYNYRQKIAKRLLQLAGTDNSICQEIETALLKHKKQYTIARYMPLIVLLIVLCLCILMYLYAQKM